jgi:hypothetical protein
MFCEQSIQFDVENKRICSLTAIFYIKAYIYILKDSIKFSFNIKYNLIATKFPFWFFIVYSINLPLSWMWISLISHVSHDCNWCPWLVANVFGGIQRIWIWIERLFSENLFDNFVLLERNVAFLQVLLTSWVSASLSTVISSRLHKEACE